MVFKYGFSYKKFTSANQKQSTYFLWVANPQGLRIHISESKKTLLAYPFGSIAKLQTNSDIPKFAFQKIILNLHFLKV